jgi:hypothetical protein
MVKAGESWGCGMTFIFDIPVDSTVDRIEWGETPSSFAAFSLAINRTLCYGDRMDSSTCISMTVHI